MLRIVNPATEDVLREVEEDSPAEIAKKFSRAAAAQPHWAKCPLAERQESILSFATFLQRDEERLAQILTGEMGKPLRQARAEISATPGRIQFFVNHVEKFLDEDIVHEVRGELTEKITYEPLGVLANISAWNYPYFVGTNVFVPALLTGNAVLYKPSEFATLTGLALADLLHEAGVPSDVFIPVIGGGEVGAEILRQPLAGVFFTGSVPTGLKIAQAAAKGLMRVQLELGGKDPVYVCEDVEVAATVAAVADGAFYNTGQSCCAVERLYVHERIYEKFLHSFLTTVREFTVGDPTDEKTYLGPLARSQQLHVLEEQVADAVAKGAKVLCGGKRLTDRKGYYFAPTVLVDVNSRMKVMREETFGPLIGLQSVKNDEEAVALMNDSSYGLTAAVYCRDRKRAENLLARLEAGTAYWNCCDRVSARLPWSGRKQSGIGATLSLEGIRAFLHPKAWHLKAK